MVGFHASVARNAKLRERLTLLRGALRDRQALALPARAVRDLRAGVELVVAAARGRIDERSECVAIATEWPCGIPRGGDGFRGCAAESAGERLFARC